MLENAINPIQQYSYTTGKNATDSTMIIDAMDVLYSEKVDGFCLVSSDSDFAKLATRLREAGMRVYGIGEKKTPEPFIVACDKFIYLEILKSDDTQEGSNKKEKINVDNITPNVILLLRNSVSDAAADGWAFMGDVGVRIPEVQYMKALRQRCSEVNALLIVDEIQTGFGRTGTFWSFEQYEIVPDILTMAKAMGGGLPIGCFSTSKRIMGLLTHDPMLGHITTFGGNPVSCAASIATIDVIKDEKLLATVEEKGRLIEKLLDSKHIKNIRRIGLMFAIEFDSFETVQRIVKYCLEHGVICFWFLSCPNAFSPYNQP